MILRLPSCRSLPYFLIGLLLAAALSGCGDGFTYVPVSGTVRMNNEPITAGTVVFVPTGDNPARFNATGKIGADGSYVLSSNGRAGVPTGSYVACVQPQMRRIAGKEAPPRRFADKYIDATDNPLKVQVAINPAAGAYDLVLTED